MEKILVTGAAGFIGSKICEELLNRDIEVLGIDNLNSYYDVALKKWRVDRLKEYRGFKFYPLDIENFAALEIIFSDHKFSAVINEAARAGVRYSMVNPFVYMTTNADGTLNLLELCRRKEIEKFILASTSSLYAGQEMPFKEELPVNTPISPYAASKKSAEMMAYSYHNLYDLDITIFRYFTVYGPAGRPDMSIFRFIKWCLEGKQLEIFGDGTQKRDFTFVDDVAKGTVAGLKKVGYEVINLGNNKPNELKYAIKLIEKFTEKKADLNYKEFHKADMMATWANIEKAKRLLDWEPEISLEEGIEETVKWTLDNRNWLQHIKV